MSFVKMEAEKRYFCYWRKSNYIYFGTVKVNNIVVMAVHAYYVTD